MLGHGVLGKFIPGSATTDGMAVLPSVAATATAAPVTPGIDVGLIGNGALADIGLLVPNTPGIISVLIDGASSNAIAGEAIAEVSVDLVGVAAEAFAGDIATLVPGSLVGVVGVGEAGTIGPAVDVGLTGVSAQGDAGSIGPCVFGSLEGVEATGIAGTMVAFSPGTLLGVVSAGEVGPFRVALDNRVITGVEANPAAGTFHPNIYVQLMGTASSAHAGALHPAILQINQHLTLFNAAIRLRTLGHNVSDPRN